MGSAPKEFYMKLEPRRKHIVDNGIIK